VLVPGITAWAQINGRDDILIARKVELDTWYLHNRSFMLDMKIIRLTAWNVIRRKRCEPLTARADACLPNMGLNTWKGAIVRKQMEAHARAQYDTFAQRRRVHEAAEADRQDVADLRNIEQAIKQSR
jgi:hypothetical protein